MSTQSDKVEQLEPKGKCCMFCLCIITNLQSVNVAIYAIPHCHFHPFHPFSYPASFWLLSNRQKLAFISFTLVDNVMITVYLHHNGYSSLSLYKPTNVGKCRAKWNLIPMVQESTMPLQFSSTEALMVSLLCNCEK